MKVLPHVPSFYAYSAICDRQFISEFGPKDLPVYLIKPDREYEIMTVEELLPNSFSPEETARFLQ